MCGTLVWKCWLTAIQPSLHADARLGQLQACAVGFTALRIEHDIGADLLAAFQHGDGSGFFAADFRDAFLHVERDAHAEEAVGQHVHHIFAQILQQLRMAIHHADLRAECGKDRNEFAGDHAAAHHQQAVRQLAQIQDRGGIQHRLFVERDRWRGGADASRWRG